MFNFNQFNLAIFNSIPEVATTTPQDDIVYGGYSLKNARMTISKIGYDNGHSVDAPIYSNPLTDLWGELSYYFRQKIVVIQGNLKADNRELLEIAIDDMKRALGRSNMDLDIKVNGNIRRAKASCVNLDSLFSREHYHITFIPFTIQFRIVSEFSKELARQTQSFNGLTAGITEEIVNIGTVRTSPVISMVFNSASGTNNITFAIADRIITVSETIASSDVLQIDCDNKVVTLNSVEIDFSGTFPILEVGTNSYTITKNWTVNYNLSISYFNNFL